MYQIKHLSFQYAMAEKEALRDISMEIGEGTLTLLTGPSGSGKSTLLRHLKKELMPAGRRSGSIWYKGTDLKQLEPERSAAEIGYLFQNPSHQMVMDTVWHEIAFGLENLGTPYGQMKRTVAEIVNYCNLQRIYDRPVCDLSGGEKQLVNLAALAAMHPKVLLLDEPAAWLDPAGKKSFLAMVEMLQKEFQMTIVMASHDLEDIMEKADQCIFLKDGQILAEGTPVHAAEKLWEQGKDMEAFLPQTIRLSKRIKGTPDFSMASLRRTMQKVPYEIIYRKECKVSGDLVLKVRGMYAGCQEREILKNFSMDLRQGEFLAVLGANGSGKTTLLKCISGQMKRSGKVRMKGRCAVLPQEAELLFAKDRLGDDLKENMREEPRQLEEYIDLFGLREQLGRHPYDLSGGQQQMAALIKVLMADPDILMLDEPTKGMDRFHKMKLGRILKILCSRGKSILCVTHDMEFAAAFADRAGMMFDGKLEGTESPRDFFTGNYFYTTTAAKITRDMPKPAVLPEEVRCL